MTAYWCERAWLGSAADVEIVDGVRVQVEGSQITAVVPEAQPSRDAVRLAGLTIPGLANCHSHAFHRALRGRTQRERGTFWTWREQMYAVAGRLAPDTYYTLAKATYREMAAAGITAVGEFHYLHHGPDGTPYDEPNAMGDALVAAARDSGLRICLLDTCYLASGIGAPAKGVQARFSDGSADRWAARVEPLRSAAGADVVVGAAIHSVRAVPRNDLRLVADWSATHALPLHVHLSEQVVENDDCRSAYGRTPTELLEEAAVWGPRTTAVHATHLTEHDVAVLGRSGTFACFCPTTERDLGDGVGPGERLRDAGSRLTLGSDSHAVIDPFEEMRGLEMDERLVSQRRGHWSAAELLDAASTAGHESLGFPDAGVIAVGRRADLVTLDLTSVRTAGTGGELETAAFAATAADVRQVVSGGRVVFTQDDRPTIGVELAAAVAAVWGKS
jgi:formiminoglutamate deiminase